MFVSMHQPDYLPWLWYFNKIAVSDVFIFFDTADNSGGGFHNRNKIKTKEGWAYLTIPIEHSHYFKPLKEVALPKTDYWARKHWKSLQMHYGRAPYWKEHSPFFEALYKNVGAYSSLSDFNIAIIEYMSRAFGLGAKLVRVSELGSGNFTDPSDTIVAALNKVGTKQFLAGPSGKDYLNKKSFGDSKIELLFQEFKAREYSQLNPPFISGLSAIDLLFNEGPNSVNYLK